ncbi:MAG: nitrous oxide reductase accessory protein NosL [Ginsengibacter sp.]
MKNKLTVPVKAIILVCGIALIAVLLVPMWKIELSAPQYPEGLVLKIYPNKLAGSVDIINGLNHYIGMKTLHTKDFIEFTILPYIISFFALLCFVVVFLNKKKWLMVLSILFCIFGIVAMIDFWRWEYNYGHDLNPEAAIQIPGMAYQPPLIGYKQLLNFGAYSIPDIGGILFFGVGIILLTTAIVQMVERRKIKKAKHLAVAVMVILFFNSCQSGPQPIRIGTDNCAFCKMTIADNRFGGEIITKKGKVFKYDDMHCLVSFCKSDKSEVHDIYLVDFDTHNFIDADKAFLLKSDDLRTPMAGNIAAFSNEMKLQNALQKFKGAELNWKALIK